jgi:hypothetical protein
VTHPRALTAPLEEQDRRVRRQRAKQRAYQRLRAKNPSLFARFYREECERVGLTWPPRGMD